jgi:hypothetical protein
MRTSQETSTKQAKLVLPHRLHQVTKTSSLWRAQPNHCAASHSIIIISSSIISIISISIITLSITAPS